MEGNVFISFNYEEVYKVFACYLREEFTKKSINVSVSKHNEISAADIERSQISVVIFSANYAYSCSRLEELVKILDCRERDGQIVIPVFYHVDPSEVRHQTGSYRKAFKQHEKFALGKTANLSGFHSSNFRSDSELRGKIVDNILMELNAMNLHSINSKELVGIEDKVDGIQSLLQKGSGNVYAIGIWGMGGIGKTTIAEEVFHKQRSKFDGCCFLENVRERSKSPNIISLKKKLYSTLLNEDTKIDTVNGLPDETKTKLGDMKVLIVLDDVNDSNHLKNLVGAGDWFGPGSRIIITSRDKQVCQNMKGFGEPYEVKALGHEDALKLFRMNAFKKSDRRKTEYSKLSNEMVEYAHGNPKVLKELGNILHGRDKSSWESQLDKLQKEPILKIYNVMKWSYDDLNSDEKCMFLDLACFFGELELGVDSIELLLKENKNDNSVAAGLDVLKDKSLIHVSSDGTVKMHKVIQAIGWKIVQEESSDPECRRGLIDPHEIYEVLKKDKGTEANSNRSIKTNLPPPTKLKLSARVFEKMTNLRFINFHSENEQDGLDILPNGITCLPSKLRYLRWKNYPLKSLPKKFSAEHLVILDLQYSQLETLWDGDLDLYNLKKVILYGSKFLKKLPNFSKAISLELLDIRLCKVTAPKFTNRHSKLKILA